MQLCLSFIGTGKYSPTIYAFREQRCETEYFPQALTAFFPDCTYKVLFTEQGEKQHKDILRERFSFEIERVPVGEDERELWSLFECIARAVPEDADLVIDVTHGLRHLPLLALAVCQYLQVAKRVKVLHILYGAYELRDKEANVSPVFDLQPFLELMTWSSATEQLWRYGNANPLAELLDAIHKHSHQHSQEGTFRARGLYGLGKGFAKMNLALSLVRPDEVLETAARIPDKLEHTRQDVENLPQAKPLELLFERIGEKVAKFTVDNANLFSKRGLAAQAEMIGHYLDTQQYQQALTLAREALVSLVCLRHDFDPRTYRRVGETLLSTWAKILEKGGALGTHDISIDVEVVRLWGKLSDLRNDINHAGMRAERMPAEEAVKNTKEWCNQVAQLLKG